jgi:hypothetical protein
MRVNPSRTTADVKQTAPDRRLERMAIQCYRTSHMPSVIPGRKRRVPFLFHLDLPGTTQP